MTLKDTEQALMREIKNAGLHRTVHHNYDDERITTVVKLYDEKTWKETKGDEPPVPEIIAMAECSTKDNFNKRKGRVIATGRAVKMYKNP